MSQRTITQNLALFFCAQRKDQLQNKGHESNKTLLTRCRALITRKLNKKVTK